MTLSKILRLTRDCVHTSPDDRNAYLQAPARWACAIREGVARGLLYTRRAYYDGAPDHSAIRLTDAGLRWCRLHPEPKRRVRVWRRA